MPDVGSAALPIYPTFKGLQGNLERGTDKAMSAAGAKGGAKFGDSAGRTMASKFGGYAKTAAKAAAIGLAGVGAAVLKIGADSIQAASDLEESTNKVQQVFGAGAERVFKFAEQAADKLGQTNQQARDAAATFGIFGKVAKLTARENAKFSIGMTRLASDFASFHNTSPEQAIEAIGAALRGEAEPIRAYGVLLDEATLKAEALALGLLKPVKDQAKIQTYQVAILEGQKKYNEAVGEYGKKSLEALKAEANLGTARDRLAKATEGTIPPLTQQQKVLAAQSAIMKQSQVAQGDFARTSDGLANAQRRLTARWENAKATLGTTLLPTVNKLVKLLLDEGIPAVERFAEWFNQDGISKLRTFGGHMKTVAGHAKDVAKFLNDIPGPAKIAGITALLGGGAALKLRGGRGGALGAVGSALGITKPIPVVIVPPYPPGFGGGPDAPDGGGKSKWLGLLGGLAKGLSLPVFSGAGTIAAHKSLAKGVGDEKASAILTGATTPGGGGFGAGVFSSDDFFPEKAATGGLTTLEKFSQVLAHARGETLKLDDTLDLVGAKKINPSFAIPGLRESKTSLEDFIRMGDKARQPISPHVQLTGVEQARAQIAGLLASIPGPGALAGIGVAGSVAASSQRRGTGERSDRGGVHFSGDIHVTAQDPNQFLTEVDKRRRRSQLDGVNR